MTPKKIMRNPSVAPWLRGEGGPKIPYRVEKTENMHSRAIYRDETIVIRLARNLTKTEEKKHVESLLTRMVKQVAKEKQKTKIDPFGPLLKGESECMITILGDDYEFNLIPGSGNKILHTDKGWNITVSPKMNRKKLHRTLWKVIAEHFRDSAEDYVHRINSETLNIKIRDFRLSFASSQWGSYSPKGIVMINCALLFVPTNLMDYVIVHELAHSKYHNHSKRYWGLVEKVFPGCKKARSELKTYRLPRI